MTSKLSQSSRISVTEAQAFAKPITIASQLPLGVLVSWEGYDLRPCIEGNRAEAGGDSHFPFDYYESSVSRHSR